MLILPPKIVFFSLDHFIDPLIKVISEIVSLGIHVIVEKPMAYCVEDAMAIARASKIGGGSVITNWPTAWYIFAAYAFVVGVLFWILFKDPEKKSA